MRELGLEGVIRSKPGPNHDQRTRPRRARSTLSDFATWAGFFYLAFVIDASPGVSSAGGFATLEWVDWVNNRRPLSPSATSRQRKLKPPTMPRPSRQLWRHNSNQMAFGKPGVVQSPGQDDTLDLACWTDFSTPRSMISRNSFDDWLTIWVSKCALSEDV